MKTKQQKFIVLLFLLITCIFLISFYRNTPNSPSPIVKGESKEKSQLIQDLNLTNEIVGETNVYDFMDNLRNEGKINFTDKTYTGMGKFIDSINGVRGDGTQNWIYYVNGKKAEIGVSNYKINKGDIVSWKYEKSF